MVLVAYTVDINEIQKKNDSCWLMSFRIQVVAQGGPPQNPEDARREQAEGSIIDSALEKISSAEDDPLALAFANIVTRAQRGQIDPSRVESVASIWIKSTRILAPLRYLCISTHTLNFFKALRAKS